MVLTILLLCFTVLFVFLKSKFLDQNFDLKMVFFFLLANFLLHLESLFVQATVPWKSILYWDIYWAFFLNSDGHLKCFWNTVCHRLSMIIMIWQLLFKKNWFNFSIDLRQNLQSLVELFAFNTHILLKIGYFTPSGNSQNLSLNFV